MKGRLEASKDIPAGPKGNAALISQVEWPTSIITRVDSEFRLSLLCTT